MGGVGGESLWTPRESASSSLTGPQPAARGPRWIISLRALVVVLAMMAAALGVLWIESASVQSASAELNAQDAGKVAVPPLTGTPEPAPSRLVLPGAAPASPGAAPASPGGGGVSTAAGSLLVHVAGAVKLPGVYTLPPGSRVFHAVEAAGGALPAAELSGLNLAAQVSDGVQILVPTKGQAAGMGGAAGSGSGAGMGGAGPTARTAALINLNTASATDFDTLPGVGPVLAQRIVAWRTDHGPFASVDALDAVSGIGAKLLAGIRDLVTVS